MRKVALVAAAALLAVGMSAAVTPAASKEEVEMTFGNFAFGEASEACPGGIITFDVASRGGAPLGVGSSCIQSFKGCEPFVVGCHQTVEARLTFALDGRDPIVVATTIHEVVLDDDPFTVRQHARGTVVDGDGHVKGEGTVAFTSDGVESTLAYVLRLPD